MISRSLGSPLAHAFLLFAGTASLCFLLSPATVNGDGLGYLRAAIYGSVVPGHLGYLPLLRVVARASGSNTDLALLPFARALSIFSAAVAAALVYATALRLLRSPAAALLAGAGLAASFGLLQAGSDVECYAPALAALCLAAYSAVRRSDGGGLAWVLGSGLATAAAALLHVENVFFAPVAAALAARRIHEHAGTADRRTRLFDAAAVLAISGSTVLVLYLCAAGRSLGSTGGSASLGNPGNLVDLGGLLRFVRGAGHGFSTPLQIFTPIIALYGVAKTLVCAPYPYEAGWLRVVLQTSIGLLSAALLVRIALRPNRPATFGPVAAIAWALPYACVGVLYFSSDNERWVLLLPAAWIVAAAGASTSPRALRACASLILCLVAANLFFGIPRARDASSRDRADAAASYLMAGDLLISPGHGWDEYIGFYRPLAVDHYPIVFYCGQLGDAGAARAELFKRAKRARAQGGRLFVARADEREDSDGWKGLVPFGLHPSNLGDFLPPGQRVRIAPGLERLDPLP